MRGLRQDEQPKTVRTMVAPGYAQDVPVEAVVMLRGVKHYIIVIRDGPGAPIYGIRDKGQIIKGDR